MMILIAIPVIKNADKSLELLFRVFFRLAGFISAREGFPLRLPASGLLAGVFDRVVVVSARPGAACSREPVVVSLYAVTGPSRLLARGRQIIMSHSRGCLGVAAWFIFIL